MSTLIESTPILAFTILISIMFLGDIISSKTKAYLPAILIFVILIMIGSWSGVFPVNIIEVPGFTSSYASYIILMFLVDMGSSISIQQFREQWKTVIVSICAILGAALLVLFFGTLIYNWKTAAISAPPTVGGMIAAIEMSNKAIEIGDEPLSRLPILIFILHSFPAYIGMPYTLKKYSSELLKDGYFKNKNIKPKFKTSTRNKLIDRIPKSFKTPSYYLLSVALLASIAHFTSIVFNNILAPSVFGLIYGMLAAEYGLIERNSIKKSESNGFLMFSSLISIFTPLLTSSPKDILSMLNMIIIFTILGVIGILLGCLVISKILNISKYLSFAIGMNALIGFPMNFILTEESINSITNDPYEKEYLENEILPTMLIAGFATVTIGSTIFASIMKNFI